MYQVTVKCSYCGEHYDVFQVDHLQQLSAAVATDWQQLFGRHVAFDNHQCHVCGEQGLCYEAEEVQD